MRHLRYISTAALWLALTSVTQAEDIPIDYQLTEDVNAIAATVPQNEAGDLVYYLVYGSSAIKGDKVIPSLIAMNGINMACDKKELKMPLVRLMRRMALRVECAKDAREYAFLRLIALTERDSSLKSILQDTCKEILERSTDELKPKVSKYLSNQK